MRIQDRTAGYDKLRRDLEADQEEQSDWAPIPPPARTAFTRADRWGLVLLWAVLMVMGVAEALGLRDIARWFF